MTLGAGTVRNMVIDTYGGEDARVALNLLGFVPSSDEMFEHEQKQSRSRLEKVNPLLDTLFEITGLQTRLAMHQYSHLFLNQQSVLLVAEMLQKTLVASLVSSLSVLVDEEVLRFGQS